MNRIVTVLSVLLAAPVLAVVHATERAISVSVAVPTRNGERRIEHRDSRAHFHVIVSNTSDRPQRIWREWCSWGYFGLTFEFTDDAGTKWVAKKKPQVWTVNSPDWWTLAAGESLVLDVHFGDSDIWEGFPRPEHGSETVAMQAKFEFKPDEESRKHGVWTGQAASKADEFVFYHWKTETTARQTPDQSTPAISRGEAVRIADEASRKVMSMPMGLTPIVEETESSFVVTYPLALPQGARGGDYYTKVAVEKRTGTITKLLAGP